ncbi:MAG: hypothetical protein R6X33_15520 [Candidatus Brocadiia bacterium]
MASNCVVCHDRPMAVRCIQCHKPVCDECAFKTEHGAFCSRECAASYRDYKQAQARKSSAGGGSLLKVLVVLIVIAAIAAAAWHFGLLDKLPGLGGQ